MDSVPAKECVPGGSRTRVSALVFILCLLSCSLGVRTFAATPEPPPLPPNYVVDLAGIIPDDRKARLDEYLGELQRKTTAQFVILTVESLDGEPIDLFSLRTAHDKWRLGQKGKDNGVLLTVSVKDRKYRFEIGYGLEGALPDSLVGTIGRDYLVPYFRKGDYGSGIFEASLVVVNAIAAQEGVEVVGMQTPEKGYPESGRKPGLPDAVFGVIFLLGVLYLFIAHPRLLFLLLMSSSIGGRRGGWSDGGGGGFGGGGGGGFGGGGSSGGW